MKERKKRRRPYIVAGLLGMLFAGVFVYAAWQLGGELWAAKREKDAFDALAARVERRAGDPAEDGPGPTEAARAGAAETSQPVDRASVAQTTGGAGAASEASAMPKVTLAPPDYSELIAMNADFFGWLSIEGTNIDYPVMYAPGRPNYYLTHAFDGSASKSGVPYLDEGCAPKGGIYLIHGHHMRDRSMFGQLPDYADREFWAAHPLIHFNTTEAWGDYQVIAAFLADGGGSGGFRYYEYTDLTDPKVFKTYMAGVKAAALYDTGLEAHYGDELLVLSTCNYHTSNGRFVVVARRISREQ